MHADRAPPFSIVGKDFLPRGSGIVTRRPLVLQLIHTPLPTGADASLDGSPDDSLNGSSRLSPPRCAEWGEFLHLDRRFTDFNDIRSEIENETLRVAGQNKGVSKLPIHLKIHSPNVLNLTMVDLPGLTKVCARLHLPAHAMRLQLTSPLAIQIPVGDQPSDIERQIRDLVFDYISKPNCIILAISPANVDLANSDSLKLARSVDPQGQRTIGVLTKLDLMDSGTHAMDILTGRVYPLKLGFIGVVNRSQKDINGNLSMLEARQNEQDFFRNHPAYRNISHRTGTKYLARTLNTVLMNHIREKLPDMKARLNTLMGQTQQELASFGEAGCVDENEQGAMVLKLMTQFARDFVASIDGTSIEISTKELCGGARIYYIFNDVFGHALEGINPTSNLAVQDIRTAIRNSTGPRPSLFVPEQAFELLIKPQIKLLEPPSLRCVELVYEELMKICHNITSTELQRFPRLHAQLIEEVSDLLRERLGPTSEYVQSLIAIQAAYINTNHPCFARDSSAIAQQTRELQQGRSRAASSSRYSRPLGADSDSLDSPDHSADGDGDDGVRPGLASRVARPRKAGAGAAADAVEPPEDGRMSPASRSTSVLAANDKQGDGFLTYFFGATAGPGAALGVRGAAPTAGRGAGDGATALSNKNMLAGRVGLEGSSAAYDMKSLGRHLGAAPDNGRGDGDEAKPAMSQREEMETSLIRALITSYFDVVRQMIEDLVPKAIMHLLVNCTRDSVQNRLVMGLYRDNLFADLLEEDEAIKAERKRVQALLDVYREAFQVLSDVTLKPTP